ncbi:MAG: T9SS type A sorting domain-containing protein [Agriterribacter sp.]
MKFILPLLVAAVFSVTGFGQSINYNDEVTWDGSVPGYAILTDSGVVGGSTTVNSIRFRINGVTYNHTTQTFRFPSAPADNAWATDFSYNEANFGQIGNNVDNFQFQGTNNITGNGNIIFDDVYFNIGVNNIMTITNYKGVFHYGEQNFGMPPCGIMITKKLYFNNGITTTNRDYPIQGAIAFVNNASYQYSTGLSDAQHVDGFVTEFVHYNNSTGAGGHGGNFTYPVGNSTEVYQLHRSGTLDDFSTLLTVGWVDGDPNTTTDLTGTSGEGGSVNYTQTSYLTAPIAAVSAIGFWDWHYQSTGDDTYSAIALSHNQTITVSIPNLSSSSAAAGDLRLVGWDAGTEKWINLSGTTGATGVTKGSTLTGVIPAGVTITALAIGSVSAILPVTFGDFTAKPVKCTALLQWKTYTEQNNSHFNVERSQDGIHFSTIAQVSGAGNSTTTKSYEYTDEAPLSGKSYYRITQVDFDGQYSSTPIRLIEMNCEGASLRVYPNPASNQITVKAGKAITQVNVLSASGQAVMQYRPSLSQNGGLFNMNIQQLQSGIYILQIINKDGTTDIIKLMKK